jgi:hypothetical protein
MSELRRKRQEARAPKPKREPQPFPTRKVIIGAIVLVAAAMVYFFGVYRPGHKYDGFAKCLNQKGLKMYGAYWCPHCQDQKAEFDAAFKYVNYTECGVEGNPRAVSQACQQAGIKRYPTWIFPDGERAEQVFTLETLSSKSGCDLP